MPDPFADRRRAGAELTAGLEHLRDQDPVVLGLPRGGVPVAAEIARRLGAPLDVIVVRKLGAPAQPELAIGAVGEDGVVVWNRAVLEALGPDPDAVATVEAAERAEVARRAAALRQVRPRLPLTGRTVVVVDDGIATGATARAACQVARATGARHVVLAAPVAPPEAVRSLADAADEVVVARTPAGFQAVGQFYRDFTQVSEAEVVALLAAAAPEPGGPAHVESDG